MLCQPFSHHYFVFWATSWRPSKFDTGGDKICKLFIQNCFFLPLWIMLLIYVFFLKVSLFLSLHYKFIEPFNGHVLSTFFCFDFSLALLLCFLVHNRALSSAWITLFEYWILCILNYTVNILVILIIDKLCFSQNGLISPSENPIINKY